MEGITAKLIGSLNMNMVVFGQVKPFGQEFYTISGGKDANQAIAAGKLGADEKIKATARIFS